MTTVTKLLKEIRADFEKTQTNEQYNQKQKNTKYSSLMTLMEQQLDIPLLAGEEFDKLDDNIKTLYLELSNARIFEV